MTPSMKYAPLSTTLVLTAIAAAALSACGGSDTTPTPTPPAPTVTMSGVVVATAFKPGSAADPTITSGYYQGASVCIDANNNGVCDASENPVTTDAKGAFTLTAGAVGPLLADIGTSAINTASGAKVASRLALRAVAAQVTEQGTAVVISPLSSDVARAMEANGSDYPTEKANLATRLGVATSAVLSDVNAVADAASKSAMQFEANALANRYTYATTKLDRKDLYPDALAVPGGDPTLKGLANVTAATAGSAADSRTAITFLQSQQAAFNIEGVPRYDHVFIVMLENKATSSILNSPFAPKINGYLQAGNQLTSYYATGNPSEPNYTAIGGADDFGITDDSQWNCDAAGAALDNVYATGTVGGNTAVIGTTGLTLPLPAQLYRTKHHPGMAYQNVRSEADFKFSNRTMGGGQWDANLKNSTDYTIPANYDYDQLSTDLASGHVGAINFLVPDQCDDMHGISVKGTVSGSATAVLASDCSSVANNVANATGGAIITRGDNYVDALVKKIKASPLWKNGQKRVAIVLMFDEGNATAGFNSCCGWNPGNSTVANPLKQNADGTWSPDKTVNGYTSGNRGHGQSVFGILTNQANAPTGIKDGDAYSHFSFNRTLQDMFQLADPAVDSSYMNRSKYTEKFIAANILNLPEYAGSADTHFDSVRPVNHAFVAPASYTQKQSADVSTPAQVGPDSSQVNVWSLHK